MARANSFYQRYYAYFLIALMVIIVILMAFVGLVLYQMMHRPLPVFFAVQQNGSKMQLTPFEDPNLLPDTILQWATKAAITAYTFDFYNYRAQLEQARPFFTPAGWQVYVNSVEGLIDRIITNQLFVNSVVAGQPVIANQGDLSDKGYTWRVQIPFLVTYQSASSLSQQRFLVVLMLVRVSTLLNPQGIGVDQFIMVPQ